jgi:hypothetical protein
VVEKLAYGVCQFGISLLLVNGCPIDEFNFRRGLRQDDCPSHIFFCIVGERGYEVKPSFGLNISHLQVVDYALILDEKSWVNIRVFKVNLILFNIIFGLKVKFHKSMLVGMNMADFLPT